MRDTAPVAQPELNTGDYPDDARVRLGQAVTRAREANGWSSRKQLADHADVSLRSVAKLESPIGELPVGRRVLDRVARSLPGWTEDTPRQILEGGEPPRAGDEPPATGVEPVVEGDAENSEDEDERQLILELVRLQVSRETLRKAVLEHRANRGRRGVS